MGFKEDLEARRQREEAKRYFRTNNPYFLSSETWMKMIGVGLGMAIVCGALYGLFVTMIHVHFSYVLAFVGIAIAKALRKVAGVGNEKVAITTVVCYFLSILFSYVFSTAFATFMYTGSFAVMFSPAAWLSALQQLFSGSFTTAIVLLIGAYYSFQCANQ